VSDEHENIALWENKICIVGKRTFPHDGNYDAQIFPTMHFPHNVSFVRMCVFSPQRPTRTHRFSPQCIICTYVCIFPTMTNKKAQIFPTMHFPHSVSFIRMCVFSPQRPTRTHTRTDFPHKALSPQCIICTCVFCPTTTN